MLSFECIKNEKSVYFLLTSAREAKYSRSWAASAEKRCQRPKSKFAGSQYMPAKSQLTA